ncbi:MAG TPA: histidine kinase, partial [Burkholderiales bacterium]|nr:histidine kinase [Burkholderiales bacterium]
LSIAFTVTLLPEAIVAFMRDETERWNEERALRKRIEELEKKTA